MEILKFFLCAAAAAGIWVLFTEYVNIPFNTAIGAALAMVWMGVSFKYRLFDIKKI